MLRIIIQRLNFVKLANIKALKRGGFRILGTTGFRIHCHWNLYSGILDQHPGIP